MKEIIIFDFDYTLGDSTDGIIGSVNFALEKLGYEKASDEEIKKTVGLSLQKTFEVLTKNRDSKTARLFEKYFRQKADEIMVENTNLYDGVKGMLEYFHCLGKRLAVVTTKYHYRIDQILDAGGLNELIDCIVGAEDVEVPKPDPEGIKLVLKRFEANLEDVLYVGDSLVDAETARAAGVDFIAVLTGTTRYEELQDYPCIKILNEAADLKDVFTEIKKEIKKEKGV